MRNDLLDQVGLASRALVLATFFSAIAANAAAQFVAEVVRYIRGYTDSS